MTLQKKILEAINHVEYTFIQRIRLASNVFKSIDVPLPHKEAFLIIWLLKNVNGNKDEVWKCLYDWFTSYQFKELTINEISKDEMKDIVELITDKFLFQEDDPIDDAMLDCSILLIQNRTFQQYYKDNISEYCKFISALLDKIEINIHLTKFLSNVIFKKNLIIDESFIEHFLEICLPSLVSCSLRFEDEHVFSSISHIVQKCIFYNNHKAFGVFINQFFEETKTDKQLIPKVVFRYVANIYENERSKTYYKLLFHAFASAYNNDFQLIYKFFILLVNIIGFNLENKLLFYRLSKITLADNKLSENRTQEILLELLRIFSGITTDPVVSVKDVNLTNFLKNILLEIMRINKPTRTNYNIISKAIEIDPLIVQHLTDHIITYAMTANNTLMNDEYENLLISVFGVYIKLHRVENLVAKVVNKLYLHYVDRTNSDIPDLNKVYTFRGKIDFENVVRNINVKDVFTEGILRCFSHCIESLASWQVINVFKTLLYSINKIVMVIGSENNDMQCDYLNILCILLSMFLSSVRVAEHTVSVTTIEKFVKCLEELRDLLHKLAKELLQSVNTNKKVMDSFLNIAFHWAEMYMVLEYYSINGIQTSKKILMENHTSYNLVYLHNYLEANEWDSLTKKIMDSGDKDCNKLLKKMFIQSLRAMYLFEDDVCEEVKINISQSVMSNIENNWIDVLNDNFIVNSLLTKTEISPIVLLAEKLIDSRLDLEKLHNSFKLCIFSSPILLNTVNYVIITEINKILRKRKRKCNEDTPLPMLSTKIYATFSKDMFIQKGDYGHSINNAKDLYRFDNQKTRRNDIKMNEDELITLLNVLKKFPIIFNNGTIQQMVILYFVSLHKDLEQEFQKGQYKKLKLYIEEIIIGILQQCKFKITETFDLTLFYSHIISDFIDWEKVFTLASENIFKYEDCIEQFQPVIDKIVDTLLEPTHLECSIIIINLINKAKKIRMSKETKIICDNYKSAIFGKLLQLITENEPQKTLQVGYAYALKHYLVQGNNKCLSEVEKHLPVYVEFALKSDNCKTFGSLLLFITIMQNKSLTSSFGDEIYLKIWNACRGNIDVCDNQEAYSRLVVLISEHIPKDDFAGITKNLLELTDGSITEKDYNKFTINLHTWEYIISCNLNPDKTRMLQNAVDVLLEKLVLLLGSNCLENNLIQRIFNFEKRLVQTVHLQMTQAMVDLCFLSLTIFMNKFNEDIHYPCIESISMLSILLRYRRPLMMDRLNAYLQQYRTILRCLCKNSNSELNLDTGSIQKISDCAHQLEKLTKSLVTCQKDVARIAMYLIADILDQYEKITIYPNVKIHLNNCIYSLISLCDQYAVSFLLRVLSSVSTEIFKIMYENYKKYYRFTGKV